MFPASLPDDRPREEKALHREHATGCEQANARPPKVLNDDRTLVIYVDATRYGTELNPHNFRTAVVAARHADLPSRRGRGERGACRRTGRTVE